MCALLLVIGLSVIGCKASTDLETGKKTYSLDPNAASKMEESAEATLAILTILGSLFPVLIPVTTAAAGIYGAYKVIKPKLEDAKEEADMYYAATDSIVSAMEKFKKTNPEQWEAVGSFLSHKIGPNTENVIRALRGLHPKD